MCKATCVDKPTFIAISFCTHQVGSLVPSLLRLGSDRQCLEGAATLGDPRGANSSEYTCPALRGACAKQRAWINRHLSRLCSARLAYLVSRVLSCFGAPQHFHRELSPLPSLPSPSLPFLPLGPARRDRLRGEFAGAAKSMAQQGRWPGEVDGVARSTAR